MKIVGAALLELSRVPADNISINKIIQNAGISRGSFYQYFQDKDDLIGFILSDFKLQLRNGLRSSLEKNQGDIFKMSESVYNDIVLMGKNEKDQKIMRNFFLSMKFTKKGQKSFWELFETGENPLNEIIAPYIGKNRLRSIEPDFIVNVFEMMFLVVVQSLTDVFSDYENSEIYRKDFYTRLDIIRRGATNN